LSGGLVGASEARRRGGEGGICFVAPAGADELQEVDDQRRGRLGRGGRRLAGGRRGRGGGAREHDTPVTQEPEGDPVPTGLGQEVAGEAEHVRINLIYDYSIRHFRRPIQLEEIAAVANISPNSFCRFFKSRTRKTYSRFLLELRVGHACKLLIENNLSIKQLCYESGFNNFTSFYKYFKLITGKSPLGYQREFIATTSKPEPVHQKSII